MATTGTNNRKPTDARDRLSTASTKELGPGSLVGSFFHSRADNGWQGCVVAEPAPGIFLVQLFEWLIGASGCQQLVPIGEMSKSWRFYDDADSMNLACEHEVQRRWDHSSATTDD